MKNLPYVIISTAMSLDGFIDNESGERLIVSNQKDFERVDAIRSSCDAILVGANTIRKDNPRLVSKSAKKVIKVTMSSTGNLDKSSNFFQTGDLEKLIYTISKNYDSLNKNFSSVATVISCGEKSINLILVLEDLCRRGIKRLMIEGGSSILTQFLQAGLVNELQISIAGFFVGEENAVRLIQPGSFPWNEKKRMHLKSVTMLDDIAVLRYLL